MKTILIPISGHDSDRAVLEAAYAIALPGGAHLDCVHVRVGVTAAARATHDLDFARGIGLDLALRKLGTDCESDAMSARHHVEAFCRDRKIAKIDAPCLSDRVTASWRMLEEDDAAHLIALARHRDLVVVGRQTSRHSRVPDLIETLLTACGRPVLLVPSAGRVSAIKTVAVWWKEHPAAARAVTAAMPLLARAERVSIVTINEGFAQSGKAESDMAHQLGWHGIKSDSKGIASGQGSVADRLWQAASDIPADLVVMGAFSHSRTRELIFGGCTQAVLEAGDLPVLLLH
jgi:nucleotide-binding universal stress UspA family protein